MATQTDLKLLLTKGPLSSLWADKAIKTSGAPAVNEGQIYFGLDTNSKRVMLFYDHKISDEADAERYVLTADTHWNDLRGLPTTLVVAREDQPTSPRVTLDYNDTTDSLDFIFT